jgi:hypothetical protein
MTRCQQKKGGPAKPADGIAPVAVLGLLFEEEIFGNSDESMTVLATLAILPAAIAGDEEAKTARNRAFEIDFMRDMHPEREVAIWCGIAKALLAYHEDFLGNETLPNEEERKLLGALVAISTGVQDVSRSRLDAGWFCATPTQQRVSDEWTE